MSKAEEFYKSLTIKQTKELTLFSFAEAYFKSEFQRRVKAISDEQIEIEFRYDNTNDSVIGAKWFKNELLKQWIWKI